ncbi:hypothetical protein LVJ82_16990 [Vitreoscilla massiliensis]|uniref:Surface-adhesin protein E-like domain-containing protein n=1 Tax=Vitreoscilla massiliensis TaxID=1689272 RepID=A0ABY4E2V4_9NEIS|nr:surface-adhesin E family protein [Vitreoscilla massiliensis]UOO89115.1 hypothetical protein LVJ82_16990 [Vitreoscilla massiliensis]
MKKIVFFCVLNWVIQADASDRWLQLNFSDSNPVMYLDLQTLKSDKYWVKYVYKHPEKTRDLTYNISFNEYSYSCKNGSVILNASHLYYETKNSNKFIKTITFDNTFSKIESVVPGSLGESILTKVCLFTNQI